jgi:hypothetical protein
MGVESGLADDQPAAGTKDAANLAQRRWAVLDLAKHGDQKGSIKGGVLERQGSGVCWMGLGKAGQGTSLQAPHGCLEHGLIDVDKDEPATGLNAAGHGQRVVAGPWADFQHLLARLRVEHLQ